MAEVQIHLGGGLASVVQPPRLGGGGPGLLLATQGSNDVGTESWMAWLGRTPLLSLSIWPVTLNLNRSNGGH